METMRNFLITAVGLMLYTGHVFADWVDITENLPVGYNQFYTSGGYYSASGFTPDGVSVVYNPITGSVTDGQNILISTVQSIYLSTDSGATFIDTEPPLDRLQDPESGLQTRLSLIQPLQYTQGEFRIIALALDTDVYQPALLTFCPSTGSWLEPLFLVSGIDESIFGNTLFYTKDSNSGVHYVITDQLYAFIPEPFELNESARSSYLWKSEDGVNWALADEDGEPLYRCYDFYIAEGTLYARLEDGIYASTNEGNSWEKIISLDFGSLFNNYFDFFRSDISINYFDIVRGNIVGTAYPRQSQDLEVMQSDTINFKTRLYQSRFSINPDTGIGTTFKIVDPVTTNEVTGWLPLNISSIYQTGELYFILGDGFEISTDAYEEISKDLVYYSSNSGQTWDSLDMTGIVYANENDGEVITPTFPSGGGSIPIIVGATPNNLTANSLMQTSQELFLVSNNDRLWRRPLSELNFEPSTQIVRQPKHAIAPLTGSTELSIVAVGTGELSYQWFLGDDAIPEATSSNYLIESLSSSNIGTYRVEVAGEDKTVTSRSVRVAEADSFSEFAARNYPTGKRGLNNDGSGSGVRNFDTYMYGTDNVSEGLLPRFSIQNGDELGLYYSGDSNYLTLTVRCRINAADYSMIPRVVTDLSQLDSSDQSKVRQVGEPVIDGDFETYTFRSSFTLEDEPKGFIQIYFEASP